MQPHSFIRFAEHLAVISASCPVSVPTGRGRRDKVARRRRHSLSVASASPPPLASIRHLANGHISHLANIQIPHSADAQLRSVPYTVVGWRERPCYLVFTRYDHSSQHPTQYHSHSKAPGRANCSPPPHRSGRSQCRPDIGSVLFWRRAWPQLAGQQVPLPCVRSANRERPSAAPARAHLGEPHTTW